MERDLIESIDPDKLPQHVAIIMDGNGRWAKKNGKERTFGHRNAIEAIRSAMQTCGDLGISCLTLFAFSSENWNRPKFEVNFLMMLLSKSIKKELNYINKNGIKLNVIGDPEKLPIKVYKDLMSAVEETKYNKEYTLTLALSYGAKDEIIRAIKNIATEVKKGEITINEIDEDLFENHLYTKGLPNVDLLIRTSGESRISNFLLWQIAYAELHFTDVLWPDFRKEDFLKAIIDYQSRERRYGKISEQL